MMSEDYRLEGIRRVRSIRNLLRKLGIKNAIILPYFTDRYDEFVKRMGVR